MSRDDKLLDELNNRVRNLDSAYCRPRDAATIIFLRHGDDGIRILMGKRHEAHKFLPGKFVFPGGRVDFADSRVKPLDDFPKKTLAKLLKGMKRSPSENRARGFGMAAIREAYEEAGVLYGATADGKQTSGAQAWQDFLNQGVAPSLAGLSYIARAITPPGRPRRFDTRFFAANANGISRTLNNEDVPTNELLERCWLTFEEAYDIDIPPITKTILEHLQIRLDANALDDLDYPVPYYFRQHGKFLRHYH